MMPAVCVAAGDDVDGITVTCVVKIAFIVSGEVKCRSLLSGFPSGIL